MVKLRRDELRFLKALADSESVAEAIGKSGITLERYRSLLRRKDFREVVADRIEEIAIRRGVTADWWLAEGMKVWSGEKKVDMNQMSVWREIGSRVRPREKAGGGGEKVQININMDRFMEAKERQKIIDGEVVKDGEVKA